jgi:hypothetical protein
MKLRLKYSLQITFVAGLLLLSACGKKENKVNSSGYTTSPISMSNPVFSGSGATGSTIVNQYNSVRGSVACLSGRNRLTNDVSFYVSGSMTGTTIGGNWQSGFMSNGTVTNMYVGVSAYRDLMFLTKVTNGSQVVGYNVTLSFCEVPHPYPNYPALVSNERALVMFQAPQGITINTATSCGYGLIAAATNTAIYSQKIPTNPYTFDFRVDTSFTKPNCQ